MTKFIKTNNERRNAGCGCEVAGHFRPPPVQSYTFEGSHSGQTIFAVVSARTRKGGLKKLEYLGSDSGVVKATTPSLDAGKCYVLDSPSVGLSLEFD